MPFIVNKSKFKHDFVFHLWPFQYKQYYHHFNAYILEPLKKKRDATFQYS